MSKATKKAGHPLKKASDYQFWLGDMADFIAFARALGKVHGHDFLGKAKQIFGGVPRTTQGYELARARLLEYATDWALIKQSGKHFSVKEILGREAQTPEDVNAAQMVLAAQVCEDLRVLKGGKAH